MFLISDVNIISFRDEYLYKYSNNKCIANNYPLSFRKLQFKNFKIPTYWIFIKHFIYLDLYNKLIFRHVC